MDELNAPPRDSGHDVAISVIIPAYNEERVIGRCIEHLRTADPPPGGFEVIVVDNGSSDRTVEVARSNSTGLNLSVVQRRGVCIGAVRNFGASRAKGKYLAFVDADCLVPRNWLLAAFELLEHNPGSIVGAPYAIPPDSSWVARTWYDYQERKVGAVPYVPGGDLLIQRVVFSDLRGFDETLKTNEDCEFCQRAARSGVGVQSFSALSVCHLGTPQTLLAFYRKQRWHGRDVFRVFFRHFPRLRNVSSVAFAFYTLACVVAFVAGAVVATTSGTYLWSIICGCALLLAPVALSLRSGLSRRTFHNTLPLAILFLTFGFARAACLVGLSTERRTRTGE
jgi:glycosyltransferase involved in cell wall biosynthesis